MKPSHKDKTMHFYEIISLKSRNIKYKYKYKRDYEMLTNWTVNLKKLEHKVGKNWLVKFSIQSPNFPCRPSPKVYIRPISKMETKLMLYKVHFLVTDKHIKFYCNYNLFIELQIKLTLVYWAKQCIVFLALYTTLGNRHENGRLLLGGQSILLWITYALLIYFGP